MLEKVIAVVAAPLHNVWVATAFTSGTAFTTTVAVPEILFVHVPFVAETKLIVVFEVTPVAVTTTVPPDPIVAVVFDPPKL